MVIDFKDLIWTLDWFAKQVGHVTLNSLDFYFVDCNGKAEYRALILLLILYRYSNSFLISS